MVSGASRFSKVSPMRQRGALIVGPVCVDEVVVDGKKRTLVGSPVYYIGKALAALGVRVRAYGTFATPEKVLIRSYLKGMEVVQLPVPQTLRMILEYDSKNPDERVHRCVYAPNPITRENARMMDIQGMDYVIMGPLFYDNTPPVVYAELHRKGVPIIYGNFGMFNYPDGEKMLRRNPENLLGVLRYVDMVFLDKKECLFVTGKSSVSAAAKVLGAQGQVVVITKGSNGSVVFSGGRMYSIPSFKPRKLVDPTGAGDTYLAGFVRALSLFDNPGMQGRFAAMCATMKIERSGAFTGSLNGVLQRLGTRV